MTSDEQFMLRALEVSKQALPLCRPNPPVGCVIVENGQIISEGFTQQPSFNHAEAQAISLLKHQDYNYEQLTAYVTLEPCSFVGKTPSCAHTLADLDFGRIVVAILDPDPRNSGHGLAVLKSSGIIVDVGVCEKTVFNFLTRYLIRTVNFSHPI